MAIAENKVPAANLAVGNPNGLRLSIQVSA